MAKFEMSKAFKEGALCDIFIPIEKFVLVLKAMREAGIFRPVCKVKSMSLLLFSKILVCLITLSYKISIPKCQNVIVSADQVSSLNAWSDFKTAALSKNLISTYFVSFAFQIPAWRTWGPCTQNRVRRLAQSVLNPCNHRK